MGVGFSGFDSYSSWYGFWYPVRTPRALIDKVNAEMHRVLADKNMIDALLPQGAEATPSSPQASERVMRSEQARWGRLAKALNLKLNG